jgi:hypothetical protein
MGINATGAVPVPLTVYGSWVTEVSPNAVPENISPDCGDVAFAPGSVGSRPALQSVLDSPFPAGGPNDYVPTIVGIYSYTLPTGQIQNLYFDSNGILWIEYFSITPGAYTQLFQSAPGSYAKFTGTFGRVYIAISDGLHGAEVPLQWDGTYLDRVTQDGPAVAPIVTMVSLPVVDVAVGTGRVDTIVSITTSDQNVYGTYTTATFILSSADTSLALGQAFIVAGNSNSIFNLPSIFGSWVWPGIISWISADFKSFKTATINFGSYATGTGGTATFGGTSLSRAGNLLTVSTATAHGLKVGYQSQLQGNGSLTVGTAITSIVINNEDNAGLATVTTSTPHGLAPQEDVTITGVNPSLIGAAGGWSALWNGTNVTLTLGSGVHGLVPGAVVSVTDSGTPTSIFVGSFTVNTVPAPNQISYDQFSSSLGTSSVTATGLSVSIAWPVPDQTMMPTYFEVQSCPTPTTFQVQVTYCDGTWSYSGTVGFPWDGTFYVTQIPSATSFICQNEGPSGVTTEVTGTVTPFGQLGPGLHLIAMCGITRQGAITAPGPFSTFISNGGQYPSVTGILPGPSNWVGRILIFTGAQPDVPGELPPFFYIPVTPMLEGQIVGTATQIDDNTTTSVLLDFADDTLYAAIGVSIAGNNIANQIVLDGALGFGAYLSRLTTWGQRNNIQNLLNMGFDADTTGVTAPQGWKVGGVASSGTTVSVANRPAGGQWQISIGTGGLNYGQLSQSLYQDCYGDPIVTGNLLYKIRGWFMPSSVPLFGGANFFAYITSASTSFSTYAEITFGSHSNPFASVNGSWCEGVFGAELPDTIPSDLLLTIYATSSGTAFTFTIDDLQLIPTETPYTDQIANASYVNNPEGFDGTTGEFGADDPSKLMDMEVLHGSLYMLTQAPTGRLHETSGSATNEPSGWEIDEVAANCGVLSAFGLTHSQADDTAASGGDEWMAWPSEGGAIIFGGGQVEKISQEIQPNWYDPTRPNNGLQINMAASLTAWGVNDPVQRLLMFGLPIGTATAPNRIYVLNYRNLGSAQSIANSPPFHPSFAGKLIATDNSRKWAPWHIQANCAARMYRAAGALSLVLGGGSGLTPGSAAGYGSAYTLNPAKFTDDDFGQIYPYYTTYFFIDPEKATALQLKGQRLLMAYLMAYIQPQPGDTNSQVTATYFPDDLTNPWPLSTTRVLTPGFYKDRQFGGGMCTGERIAIKISSSPITGTDNSFIMSRLTAFLRDAKLIMSGVNK